MNKGIEELPIKPMEEEYQLWGPFDMSDGGNPHIADTADIDEAKKWLSGELRLSWIDHAEWADINIRGSRVEFQIFSSGTCGLSVSNTGFITDLIAKRALTPEDGIADLWIKDSTGWRKPSDEELAGIKALNVGAPGDELWLRDKEWETYDWTVDWEEPIEARCLIWKW